MRHVGNKMPGVEREKGKGKRTFTLLKRSKQDEVRMTMKKERRDPLLSSMSSIKPVPLDSPLKRPGGAPPSRRRRRDSNLPPRGNADSN
ncbi:hypothetical protein AOLI_G00024940 [Acnodon oligacanthus]